jgi:Cdc6-like AAA superfamily ATPase
MHGCILVRGYTRIPSERLFHAEEARYRKAQIRTAHSEFLMFLTGWTIFFSSSWGRFDHRFSSLLINIERLSEQIDREAVALDIMATAEWRSKNADDASKRDEQWQTQQLHATINWLGIEDDMQEAKLEMNASKCYAGTCHWILKSGKIRTWLERKRGNPILWLNGKPGSGKSILSSMLIRFLRSDPNRRVCFFFCDYNTSALDIGTQILRTICSQIIRMAPDLVPYVYDECLGKAHRASSDVLRRIIPQLFARFDDVNLIVDGIDEIPSSEHRSLIITLLQLSKSCSGLKLLLVSQDLSTISTHLSKKPTLCLREEAEATREDHAIMVEGSLKELNDDRHGAIGDALMEKLKKDILDKSEGSFSIWDYRYS